MTFGMDNTQPAAAEAEVPDPERLQPVPGNVAVGRALFRAEFLRTKEAVMTRFCYAVIAVALVTSAANAQTTVITREPPQSKVIVTTQPLQLTPEQRRTIYRMIALEGKPGARAAVQYRVGMRVPETVHLYPMPETVTVEVPVVRTYKYMMVNNRVVLVDPVTSEVIAEVAD
jgi:hypothetical protein